MTNKTSYSHAGHGAHKEHSSFAGSVRLSSYADKYLVLRTNLHTLSGTKNIFREEYIWKRSDGRDRVSEATWVEKRWLSPEVINSRISDMPQTILISLDNVFYVLRRTSVSAAKYLVQNAHKLTSFVDAVVGFVKTTRNITYLITRVVISATRKVMWVLDEGLGIGAGVFRFLSLSDLSNNEKHAIFDKVESKLRKLYASGHCVSELKLSNIVITDTDVLLFDPLIVPTRCRGKGKGSIYKSFEDTVQDLLDMFFGDSRQYNTNRLNLNYHISASVVED